MKRIKQHSEGAIKRHLSAELGRRLRYIAEIAARELLNWWGVSGPPEGTTSREHWNKYVTQQHIDEFKKEQEERDRLWEKAYDFSKLEIGTINQSEWDKLIAKTTKWPPYQY